MLNPLHHYELTQGASSGEFLTDATPLAAALHTLGAIASVQNTRHIVSKTDKAVITWRINPVSTTIPGLNVRELSTGWQSADESFGAVDEHTPPAQRLFCACMFALEARATMHAAAKRGFEAAQARAGSLARYVPRQNMSEASALRPVFAVPADSPVAVVAVDGRKLAWALMACGFVMTKRTVSGQFLFCDHSATIPGLTIALCRPVFQEIEAAHKPGDERTLPEFDLPGFPAGWHPFPFAVQALFNLDILFQSIARARQHHFLAQGPRHASAVFGPDAEGDAILAAVRHSGVKI